MTTSETGPVDGAGQRLPRVLVLSSNYPSAGFPTRGLWVRRMVQAARPVAEPVVVAPLPLLPMGLRPEQLFRNLRTPLRARDAGVPVHHPRTAHLPLYAAEPYEERIVYPTLARLVGKLHRAAPFDLIHAHFIYPEGVLAARLGRAHGLPVVTTEHANWTPWLERAPGVRRRVEQSLGAIDTVSAVSEATAATVREVAGDRVAIELLPNGVDETVFRPVPGIERDPDRLVFVGAVRHTKGLDVLVDALAAVARQRPRVRLDVIGEPFFYGYRKDEALVRERIARLGLGSRIRFRGHRNAAELARELSGSALLVLPSRRESFGAVLIEAMACGTPVVATRCGGPSEVVPELGGRLADVEDPAGLADAIVAALERGERYDRQAIRDYVVERYGVAATRRRLASLYTRALRR